MITSINLSNFKCFEKLSLPISPLTLFSGFNAGGKSSVYQSLLLLAQSFGNTRQKAESLILNGNLVRLGSPGEVICNKAKRKEIKIEIQKAETNLEFFIELKEKDYGDVLQINSIKLINENQAVKEINIQDNDQSFIFKILKEGSTDFFKLLSDIVYISAVRGGPLDVYPSPDDPQPSYADVGIEGELAPWWFYRLLDEEIDVKRRHHTEDALTLRRQFNAWAGELFTGAQGHVQAVQKTSLMRLELRMSELDDWMRPANIGYGLSYAFPVLVAGLIARQGQMLIIDSPEAHLHPLGQSRIGSFLAQMAAAGVQIIIETHSDHILNGVRLALQGKNIQPEDVCLTGKKLWTKLKLTFQDLFLKKDISLST